MTTDLITITQEAPLNKAKDLMQKHKINCLPVVRKKELLGIITSSDF